MAPTLVINPLTCLAFSVSGGFPLGILRRVRMALRAVSLRRILCGPRLTSKCVDLMSDRLKMFRVHACASATKMVVFEATRGLPCEKVMSPDNSAIVAELPVAIPVHTSYPKPAAVGMARVDLAPKTLRGINLNPHREVLSLGGKGRVVTSYAAPQLYPKE